MAQIYILGTSNSVIGAKGYVEALELQHEVTNRSSGRNSLVYHICQILQNRTEIEAHDLLIIDHYGNDANFYRGLFGDRYPDYLEIFYQLLATLNVPVLNLMFPRMRHKYPEVRGLVREVAMRHRITSLDLNEAGFQREHFMMDALHLNRYASYMMGIFLSQSLARKTSHKPIGGTLLRYPMRVIPAREVAPDLPLQSFESRVSRVEYVRLDREIQLPLTKGEKVISVGYFRDAKETLQQGFVLDGKPYGVMRNMGFFQEMTSITVGVRASIAPVVGTHDQVEILARGNYISGVFTPPCLTNLLVQDIAQIFSGRSANHEIFEISMSGLTSAIDAASAKIQSALSQAPSARPPIRPLTVDYLRDTALSHSNTELDRAIDLMGLAHFLRPQGKFIANKLKELRGKRTKLTTRLSAKANSP